MDRGQNGRDDVFRRRDPFAAGFAGFGPHRSLISGFFGGKDPFDDPFFTRPFGGPMMRDHDMFGPSPFGPMGGPFGDMRNDGFIEQAPPRGNGRRPVITEIDEDEGENAEDGNQQPNQDSYVLEPDDGNDEGGQVQLRRDLNRADSGGQPQARTFTYQSSSVTYGGINGAYYTASKTRRTGSDGITVEESKEADTTTKEATHRISRGIHDKGHSLTRKLNSDGNVDTTQTLHNLNEDELAGFEESWKGNAGHYLPGWNQNAGAPNSDNSGWSSASHVDPSRSAVALLRRQPPLTLSSPPVGVLQVIVAPMDVTGDRPGAGRFLGPSKVVIQGAMESQNHESSQSLEESAWTE